MIFSTRNKTVIFGLLSLLLATPKFVLFAASLSCGCNDCTTDVLDTLTSDGFTCGQRITALLERSSQNYTEEAACQEVAERFPKECGPQCHPYKCDDNPSYCGCQDCTEQIWTRPLEPFGGGELPEGSTTNNNEKNVTATTRTTTFTCGNRIRAWQDSNGDISEEEACSRVSEEYPLECGPFCHPSKCDSQAPPLCGCKDCTEARWNTVASEFTCGERVLSLLWSGKSEEESCRQVAVEFPDVCGPHCHPDKCDDQPLHCGCYGCAAARENESGDDDITCGERIDFLQTFEGGFKTEVEACDMVSREYPKACGQCNVNICDAKLDRCLSENNCDFEPLHCGCHTCTTKSLDNEAEDATCGERIQFLQSNEGGSQTEEEACLAVAREYPDECGQCNVKSCDGKDSGATTVLGWLGMTKLVLFSVAGAYAWSTF